VETRSQAKIDRLKHRTAARRQSEIPAEVVDALSRGWIESKNLVEWLSVDRLRLLKALSIELSIELNEPLLQLLKRRPSISSLQLSKEISKQLALILGPTDTRMKSLETHPSDVVREWGALIVGHWSSMPFSRRLAWIKPFADDSNPGTREIAWMALRAQCGTQPA
jgi:hypothetical protein